MSTARERWRGVLTSSLMLLVLWLLASTAVSVYTVVAIRQTQVDNVARSKVQTQILTAVQGCTTPKGACYEQTSKQVASINQVTILAAACAANLPDGMTVAQRQDRIQSCVIDRLAATR